MQRRKFLLLPVLLSILSVGICAQTKTEVDEILRIETQLVEVPLVVTDKSGKPVLNLKQSNFAIYENGKPQEITEFFSTGAPFEVALLLDTSGSTRSDLALIQRAAENFINSLRPGDRVSIIAFKSYVEDGKSIAASEVLCDLTDDRVKLKNALAQVKTSNGTPYYDGLLQVAERIFQDKPAGEFRGRRALVALTDGVDSTSIAGFDEIEERFAEAGFISYFIQVNTREFFEENLLGDCQGAMRFSAAQIRRYYRTFYRNSKVEKTFDFCRLGDFERLAISKALYELADLEMRKLAERSGGKIFPVVDLTEARAAFKRVADEIGTKYSLGYYPSDDRRDGTFRKIEVKLKGVPAGAMVQAREGYTAPKD
jgi:Ca-activated chloride channel homolog